MVLDECPSSPLLQLLRYSPNLVELSIQNMNLLPDATEALVFPHLRRLSLGLENLESDDHILACITAPALESLVLMHMRMDLDQLVSFLQRSSPPLHKLQFDFFQMQQEGLPLDSDLLDRILDACPTVTELAIGSPYFHLIERLSAIFTRSDPSTILPNLQTLEFSMCHTETFRDSYWNVLLPVLVARRTVRTLCIHRESTDGWNPQNVFLDSFVSQTVLPVLKELEAGGLSFWFGTKDTNTFPS
ncbi:hypothetical protein FB45DRAFT_1022333 [Roridomyces roridus]|uniref:F-box domain-containing protein n=1 Tax=Roridomyces roridus TaxID=1738132 RepID=A0AAD7C7V3_9AGAR|nr:hypothetical protein FB45DRAFT_1022333 [Roridomyces roridus]